MTAESSAERVELSRASPVELISRDLRGPLGLKGWALGHLRLKRLKVAPGPVGILANSAVTVKGP